MPKCFYHFCGASGVGKKTIVKKLVDNSVPGLRERFGIAGELAAYGDFAHPGVKPMWQYVWAEEINVLHFWQFATHGWIAHNMRAHPGFEQRIYLVWQPYDIHSKNLAGRAERAKPGTDVHTWRPSGNELRTIWNQQLVPLFRQIEVWGLKVEVIDAATPLCDPLPIWPD
jgi:hypothetical protein